jgi:uncharacterized membrane protein
MFTPYPYLNYYYKYVGIIFFITGITLMMLKISHSKYGEWLILFGLFCIAYTKDNKIDPELRNLYQYNSFRITFAISFVLIITTTFSNIHREFSNSMDMVFFGIGYLMLYLLVYYIHVLFKIKGFKTDQNTMENYKTTKSLYITLYIFLAIIIIVLLYALTR